MAALFATDPAAVLVGLSAAFALDWPRLPEPSTCTAASVLREKRQGFSLTRRRISPDHIIEVGGVRATSPALTALDLARAVGPSAIDDALRMGIPLSQLWDTLEATPGRRGNETLRQWLKDSRDEPWSPAERAAHVVLRKVGITGWHANYPVKVRGRRAYVDLAFPELRLAIEIDGGEFHSSWADRNRDMARDRDLLDMDWVTYRFPASLLFDDPDAFIAAVQASIKARRRALRLR